MIQTLHQAHDEIKNDIDRKNYPLAQDMLGQCQECAISIGTAIEKLEGEGFVTVSYVETYCDVVFSVFEELNGADVNANKVHKNLKKQLLRIENSVKNDVPVRKEIAFFPYKASMWDSLESVYLAAKEDPDCDVYCVPIPYYDKKPDRSLGQMHYEGREYPKNIEVIDWQTYNFEERKPDVIYIHNPYDDWNLVTSVPPRYFSSNLKRYTEKLVYIPYFVLGEIEPHEQEKIEKMKHFCFLPGTINADKVIVQSENMKQIYVNEYLKAAQANNFQGDHVDRKKLEEKFLGLGSPKFDKVQNTKKEDLEIPDEWLKIIEKPDGSWKKIIFYNTSIAALLEHNEKMLEKMKDVFRIFKENKDEVALLWRPHPLIRTTIESMRPQLWIEYDKLVKQYKEDGWGIYDDSADLDRAVVLSDAYYGDGSSVVQVCQKVGMPVMIQDVEYLKEGKEEIVATEAIIKIKETYYFVPFNDKRLYKMDENLQNLTCLKGFDEKRENGLYIGIAYYEDRLFFIPKMAEKIAVFNLKTEEIKYITFKNDEKTNSKFSKFLNYHVEERYLYLIPYDYSEIVKLNMDSGCIQKIKIGKKTARKICAGTSARIDGQIYIPCEEEKIIYQYNMRNDEVIECERVKNRKYRFVFAQGTKMYFIPYEMKEHILIWETDGDCIREMEITADIEECEFTHGIIYKGKLYLTSTYQKNNIWIDLHTEEMGTWLVLGNETPEYQYKYLSNMCQLLLFESEERLYLVNGITNEWFVTAGTARSMGVVVAD